MFFLTVGSCPRASLFSSHSPKNGLPALHGVSGAGGGAFLGDVGLPTWRVGGLSK